METISTFSQSTHGIITYIALGLFFIVTSIKSLNGHVKSGKTAHGIPASFILILFGIKYTSSLTLYFWGSIAIILLSYITGIPSI